MTSSKSRTWVYEDSSTRAQWEWWLSPRCHTWWGWMMTFSARGSPSTISRSRLVSFLSKALMQELWRASLVLVNKIVNVWYYCFSMIFRGKKMVKYLNEVLFLIYVDIFTSHVTEVHWWYIFLFCFGWYLDLLSELFYYFRKGRL